MTPTILENLVHIELEHNVRILYKKWQSRWLKLRIQVFMRDF